MKVYNLTPHQVSIYSAEQFINLEKLNETTYVADTVEGVSFPSEGIARIKVKTVDISSLNPKYKDLGEVVCTEYGDITGIPKEVTKEDLLIVSLPTKKQAEGAGLEIANQMVSPYKVVRERANTSNVLGCMGITF
jgi:hypothetical protein